jgi:hypothetical protein
MALTSNSAALLRAGVDGVLAVAMRPRTMVSVAHATSRVGLRLPVRVRGRPVGARCFHASSAARARGGDDSKRDYYDVSELVATH